MVTGMMISARRGRYPVAIWITLGLSIGIHLVLLADFQSHSLTGNKTALPGLRLSLDINKPPSVHTSARRQQESPPKSRTLAEQAGIVPEPSAQTAGSKPAPQTPAGETARKGRAADERARYIESLLREIESHKYYPIRAKRRGMEGRVHVAFTMFDVNDVRDVAISGESPLFKSVAREALMAAMPFSAPPKSLGWPLDIEYVMAFSLD